MTQRFKTFLTEGSGPDFAPWHVRDPAELNRMYQDLFKKSGFNINKNGTVSGRHSFCLVSSMFLDTEGRMTFKLQSTKDCRMKADKLSSVWGAPDKCHELVISSPSLLTLEHLNTNIKGTLFLTCTNLKEFNCNVSANGLFFDRIDVQSLTRIDKYFDIRTYMTFNGSVIDKVKSNILSILLMKNLRQVTSHTAGKNNDFTKSILIVDKHLRGERDVLECQEELISAGYKEFAKL